MTDSLRPPSIASTPVGHPLEPLEKPLPVRTPAVGAGIDSTSSAEAARGIVQAAMAAFRARHPDTADHMTRVGVLAAELGSELGWAEGPLAHLALAGRLHDIGKIGLPDSLLHKPGRLNRDEYRQVREHAALGAEILGASTAPDLQLAATVARSHHERWDGGGYPDGLAGLDIPLAARIIAVVDVYDALLNARVYRVGLPQPLVLRLLRAEVGTRFDPWVFDAFTRLVKRENAERLPLIDVAVAEVA